MGTCNKKWEHFSLDSLLFFSPNYFISATAFNNHGSLIWSMACFVWLKWEIGTIALWRAKQLWRRENTKSVRCTTSKESLKHKAYLAHILSIWTCILLQQEKLIPHPTTLGAVQCFSTILRQSCYPFTVWVLVSPFLGWHHMNHMKHTAP